MTGWSLTTAVPAVTGAAGELTTSASGSDTDLPEAPRPTQVTKAEEAAAPAAQTGTATQTVSAGQTPVPDQVASPKVSETPQGPVGADGKPIRPQTGRVFGIFPNFVAVSGGTKPKPAGWKTDFAIANKQNYDYSSFGFLLISSGLAYAQDSHPAFKTYNGGDAVFWAYLWRGFVDKTDAVYQGSFFFPALLHEDTRYYALGTGPAKKRLLHAVAAVVVAHNYDQKPIFNLAGQAGRVGTQAVSKTYYPAGSEDFGVLAEKYAYSNLRSVIFNVIREFSPDAQAFVARRHERKAAEDAAAAKQGE